MSEGLVLTATNATRTRWKITLMGEVIAKFRGSKEYALECFAIADREVLDIIGEAVRDVAIGASSN